MVRGQRISLGVMLLGMTLLSLCSGSAIPMWEYLSRGEKMSHLYSMFAKQVSSYCKNSQEMPTNMCKRNLLMYGINKLQDMNESHLDSMDPYQRGAHDIIWDAMMDGHTKNGRKKIPNQSTEAPAQIVSGQFEHNPLFDDPAPQQQNRKQDTVDAYQESKFELNNAASSQSVQFAEPQNYLYAASNHFDNLSPYEQNTNFLSGPMVVRLRPDGTAVDEPHQKVLPKDDDIKEMTIGQEKMPSFQQIYDSLKRHEEVHVSTTETATSPSATSFVRSYRTEYRSQN
ncbi:rhythmically expressed gene 5 protein [Toxorhynchites rutilus septentrionalis]|uniref:rhythmically expressed gene 5 protein n=1 Tax=Toxorhynchites rutilus septentrionalis TaxID=329112 RepID=UPI00247892D8|nr:rhythmically expressed gene 5 protein [Toxorhynchites rutilus septentrionalis]